MKINFVVRRFVAAVCLGVLSLGPLTGCNQNQEPSQADVAALRQKEEAKAVSDIQNDPNLTPAQKEAALQGVKQGFASRAPIQPK